MAGGGGGGGGGGELDIDALFESWDDNRDGSLSMLEIIQGLRFGGDGTHITTPMVARILWHLKELQEEHQDPDWDYLGRQEFQDLLETCPPAEAVDPAGFLDTYGSIALIEALVPGVVAPVRVEFAEDVAGNSNRSGDGGRATVSTVVTSSEGYDDAVDGDVAKSRVERVFESWDGNGDGSLSALEIKEALEREEAEGTSLLKEQEVGKVVQYIAQLEARGEALDWQYLDPDEFREIVWAGLEFNDDDDT